MTCRRAALLMIAFLAGAVPASAQVAPPRLTVSNDPADGAQYATINEAVAAATVPGTTIVVYRGLRFYEESVRLERPLHLTIEGFRDGSGIRPAVYGHPYAIDISGTVGAALITLDNLAIHGMYGGISCHAGTLEGRNLAIQPMKTGLEMWGGTARLVDSTIEFTETGVFLSPAALTLERVRIFAYDHAINALGSYVTIRNSVIDGYIRGDNTGTLSMNHATVGVSSGKGLRDIGHAFINLSIVKAPIDGRLECTMVFRSILENTDCSASNDNVYGDPMLLGDGTPMPGSPAIDIGSAPPAPAGEPAFDIRGLPRRIDGNADGIAKPDAGAFEYLPSDSTPGEVTNLRWVGKTALAWDAVPTAVTYHQYRGPMSSLSQTSFGTCTDGVDGDHTDLQADASERPMPGTARFFLVTARDAAGSEGTLGFGTFAERSNFQKCF